MGRNGWGSPVLFRVQGSAPVTITSVGEASHYLMHHWPEAGSRLHAKAQASCTFALKGERTRRAARRAFIRAANEAAPGIELQTWQSMVTLYPK
jgi:hypothetical protein